MRQNNFRQFIVIFFFFVYSLSGYAQSEFDFNYYKEKYPDKNLVRLKREITINIGLENDEIIISQTSIDETIFLNETATQFSKGSVSYSTFNQLEEIDASSLNLVGDRYKENKVTDFFRKDELDGSFHDDIKSVNFIYPNLDIGSKIRLVVKEKVTNPRFLSLFFFGGYYPTVYSKITIIADNNIYFDFKEFNTNEIDLDYSVRKKRNTTTHTWISKDIDAYKIEDATPNYKNYFPHIIPIITQYENKNGELIKLSSQVSDLYDWYYSLIKNINQSPSDPELIKLVDQLIKDKKSDFEKVRAIYYWVQNNIKYIAFEYALGGFIPREANEIFHKKYGDCKDNSSILWEMLKIAGIRSNISWIGTRSIPYKYDEVPTPIVDNHMILSYENDGKHYFLDATGRYIPLELPTTFIQGKEALISRGKGNFEIIEVPVVDSNVNMEIDSTYIRIDNKKVFGKSTKTARGYNKIDIYNSLEELNTSTEIKDFYKELLQKGNNKFILENLTEINKYDYDKDYKIKYDFVISDYIITTADEIYINLNLEKILLEYKIDDNRKTDIEIDYKASYKHINELSIPKGYSIEYLPENINLNNHLLSASISFDQVGDKIIYTHKVKFNFLILKKEDHKEYKDLLKKVEKAYKEIIVLKKLK